ncbi:hypothetical protein LJW61_004073 [Salmonella enterica]|nr:hypothetical protein [Salmonella enterica subsp. enterica serovar Tucson]EIK1667342.1 hypothetical protein [Salmonella enterica]
MAAVLDELVLALDIESKDFTAGEQAAHAALDRLTAAMERVPGPLTCLMRYTGG